MRTLILGIGAQKAGTTWLFNQLIKAKNYKAGLVKEYNLFNSIYLLHLGEFNNVKKNIPRRIKNSPFIKTEQQAKQADILLNSFYDDAQNYLNYIDTILNEDNAITSDISPCYALLPIEAFEFIKTELKKRNIRLKVVFLMREPVSRLESSIKMKYRRFNKLKHITSKELLVDLNNKIKGLNTLNRGNYQDTFNRLETVFKHNEVYYGFYETLFEKQELDRLSNFLNVDIDIFNIHQKVNKSGFTFKYKARDIKRLKTHAISQYEFVQEQFGFDIDYWHQATSNMTQQLNFKEKLAALFNSQ